MIAKHHGLAGKFSGGTVLAGAVAMVMGLAAQCTHGQTPTILHSFAGAPGGEASRGRLVQGSDTSFYGTTALGGTSDRGTVFKITPAGVLTTLYSFSGIGSDGDAPGAGLVKGLDGNFYGTTEFGGTAGWGTVFKITPAGVLTTLHSFSGTGSDGSRPAAGLVQGSDTNFYGTTWFGGTYSAGTVFKITPAGVLTTLHSFSGIGSDGRYPTAELVQGADSNFYGTTEQGGTSASGTVFRITPGGALTPLLSFSGTNGAYPETGLLEGRDGSFYGSTSLGGASGYGTIFKMTPGGALTPLHSFSGSDGAWVEATLVQGTDTNFYGATSYDHGTIFKMTPGGALTTIYTFTGATVDGSRPYGGLVQGMDGNLYGTTEFGGAFNWGTVFKIRVPSRWWSGAADLSGYWKWLDWFGYFNTAQDPWIYHLQHGWMYGTSESSSSVWLWNMSDMGWLWTSSTDYSFMYRAGDAAWLWYQYDSSSPRWFYNYKTNGWEAH